MLRPCDAEPYIRLKEKIESRPTNSNAIYQDGKVRPVFIYTLAGKDTFVVEGEDYKFYPAQQVPGSAFIRWENKPDAQPQMIEPPAVESTKIKGSTWAELKADAERRNRKALGEQYAAHQAQQGVPAGDRALAQAGRDLAQVVASLKGQRR